MRKAYLLLLVLFVGQSLFPLQLISAQTTETVAQKTGITPGFALLDGTPVRLRLSQTVSSKDAKTGENIDFEVLEDVRLGEVIVIPKESVAIATILRAKPSGRFGKGGKLDIKIGS